MKVITEEITLHAFSIPKFILPTFQRARFKKVYNKLGICIAQYVIFVAIENLEVFPCVYKWHYVKVK